MKYRSRDKHHRKSANTSASQRTRTTERNCYFVVLDFGYTDCAHQITKQKASNRCCLLCVPRNVACAKWLKAIVYYRLWNVEPARSKCTKISTFVSKKRHIKTSLSRFTSFCCIGWDTKPFVWMAVAQTSMTACFLFQCSCVCLRIWLHMFTRHNQTNKAPNKTTRTRARHTTSMKSNISSWSCNKRV